MNILARFAGWWAGLSMLLATLGTCPCCGGPPCARGVAVLGLIGALVPTFWRPKARETEKQEDADSEIKASA